MLDTAAQRANMVASQLRTNDVRDSRICEAMHTVPREIFVPERFRPVAYMDRTIELARNRVLMDARCFGKLVQLAAITHSDVVLDVGCGTGYSAVVIGMLAARVFALESDAALATAAEANIRTVGTSNVQIVRGTLTEGDPEHAPFDVILVEGAVEQRPEILLDQLKDLGRLVTVKRNGAASSGCIYVKHGTAIGEREAFDAWLPILPGFERPREFTF
jgi:protein-L-isoaspartate(D-aspartate) O-methyltransferase